MRLLNINNKLIYKNVSKYRIDWKKKSRSKLQTRVKRFLEVYWANQVVYEEFPVYGSRLKVDFLNATKKIAIEVNGPQHNAFNPFFHKNSRSNFIDSIKRDLQKAEWLERNKYHLIEIEEEEIPKLSEDFIVKKSKYFI